MAEVLVYTYQDVVEHLIDHFSIDRTGLSQRHARRAAQLAYLALPNYTNWLLYDREAMILTSASYSTGTVEYDHAGGSSERLVTLTGGTWPSWAARGRLIIAGVHYPVENYLTGTTITLRPDLNPAGDVAALTTFTLYRSVYTLPINFRRFKRLWDMTDERDVPMIAATDQHVLSNSLLDTPGTPDFISLRNDGEYLGAYSLWFVPPPSSARRYALLYEAQPRALRLEKHSTGTASITAGDTTVTFSNDIPNNIEGCIFRITTSTTLEPTGLAGGPVSGDNIYDAQRVIQTRTGSTSVELDAVISSVTSYTNMKYTISDPIEIESVAMYGAYIKLAEYYYAQLANRPDQSERYAQARHFILLSMENDNRTGPTRVWYDQGLEKATISTES